LPPVSGATLLQHLDADPKRLTPEHASLALKEIGDHSKIVKVRYLGTRPALLLRDPPEQRYAVTRKRENGAEDEGELVLMHWKGRTETQIAWHRETITSKTRVT
jgi:hypothetical protein